MGGSLLFKEFDVLILSVGRAFVLDPAENTLFAAARRSSVEWWFTQVQVVLCRLSPC